MKRDKNNEANPRHEKLPVTEKILAELKKMNGQMTSMNGHVTNIDKNLNRVEGKVDLLLLNRLKGKNTDNQIETNLIEESKKLELKKNLK